MTTMSKPVQEKVIKERKPKIWTPGQIVLMIVILIFSLTCLLPFVNVAAVSFSSKSAILRGDVSFWPVDFNTTAYHFSGGTIPIYLNIKELGLLDTPWSLILPGMLSTYNMIILRSFFNALPKELEEAAIIDGANDFQVLLRVYLPLSMASLATLTLFYAVGKWNSFQDALYYISNKAYQPLQLKLYHIIKGSQAVDVAALEGGASTVATSVSESIEPATIIFATLPILVVYPFVQRYFVAGVTIGAVKG